VNKKEAKKTLIPIGVPPAVSHPAVVKVFFASFLFTKKKTLPPAPALQ
jgi:hypothetical protein